MSKHKNKKSGRGKGNTASAGQKSSTRGRRGQSSSNGNGQSHGGGAGVRDTVPHAIVESASRLSDPVLDNGDGAATLVADEGAVVTLPAHQEAGPAVLVIEEEPDEPASQENGHSEAEEAEEIVLRARVAAPAPVKARVGQPLDSRPFNGKGNGRGTGLLVDTNGHDTYDIPYDSNGYAGNGNGNGNGHTTGSLRRARISLGRDTVVVAPGTVHPTTGHLRQSDLLKARVRNGHGSGSAATMPLFLPRPQRPTARL